MNKLCLIYNTAPHYREAIFKAIDKEYDCDWFFGKSFTDIKEMDLTVLKNTHYYKYYGNPSRLYWKSGTIGKLFKRKYKCFFMLVESRAVSDYVFIALKSLLFPKIKVYVWTHGWYGKESGLEAKLKLWQFKHVIGIFVYGNYARNLLMEQGVSADKLFTIHNSLHYNQQKSLRDRIELSTIYKAHFNNENPTIIFIGRLTSVKRLDMLLNAIANLQNRGEAYNVVFVGDGEKKDNLKKQAKEMNIINVWFYGACYDEKTNAELIYNADLCVSPGNVGLTAIHTLMFGCPVITHNCYEKQMPEFEAIRSGETGDFFEYEDEKSLTDTISKWFRDKGRFREEVRKACFREIDTLWNPYFQMDVIKKNLKV